jgi:hypothetical protein
MCKYWKLTVIVLRWKLPVVEIASTDNGGTCRYRNLEIQFPWVESAGTGKLKYKIVIIE